MKKIVHPKDEKENAGETKPWHIIDRRRLKSRSIEICLNKGLLNLCTRKELVEQLLVC